MSSTDTQPTGMYAGRRKSRLIAGLLSIMPGLGQIYVGYYRRGFTQVVIVASVMTLLSSRSVRGFEPFFGFFISFFWMYSIIDAIRLASLYNDAMAGLGPEDLRHELVLTGRGGSIAGGIGLILVGVLFLLNTVFGVSMDWLKQWWPVAAVGFGIYLVYRGIQDQRRRSSRGE